MSILSTNRKLIRVGTEYSAGPNIDIQDDVISGKDWTDEIAEASANAYNAATAQIPDPFDPSYISGQIDNKLDTTAFTTWHNGQYTTDLQTVEGQISNKLDESAFSDVSCTFYTNDNPSGFITGVDLSPYYTTADANSLSSMISGAIDYVSANAGDDFPQSADEAIQTYQQYSGTYLTEDDIVNKLDISAFTAWSAQEFENDYELSAGEGVKFYEDDELKITRIDVTGGGGPGDEEVNSFVYDNSATILDVNTTYQQNSATYLTSHQDISYKLDTTAFSTVSGEFLTAAPADMATTGDIAELAQTVSETYQVKGDYLTTADSANFYPMTGNPSSFATENWVTEQGYITGVDLSEYAKRDFVLSSIESATSGKLDVSSFASVSGDFLVAESLNGYATEQWVGEQGYLTEVSIPESANWNEAATTVQTNSSNWDNVTNKLDTTSFSDVSSTFLTAVDLTPYQTIEGMTAYQPAGSYATTNELEQVSGDITALIPSTAGLASESYVQTNSAVLTGMIDGKQDTLTFGYDEQDRISSINNSALAGGGDVPEDVMVETNLEYNAVNEISAYNGSAIAQYGAEKQWLVHDDTIVHISNSAQYAFGCNISALQRLMGVDETVLYSASTSESVIHLSEPLTNFKEVKVDYKAWERVERKTIPTDNLYTISLQNGITWGQGSGPDFYNLVFNYEMNTSFDTISALAIRRYSTNTANAWSNGSVVPGVVGIVKVIGIGRKQ